jgi:hypothetical protein
MATTFHALKKIAGSNMTSVNVDRDGKPFGSLWTFTAKGETHGWHAQTLKGAYKLFEGPSKAASLAAAKAWMEAA